MFGVTVIAARDCVNRAISSLKIHSLFCANFKATEMYWRGFLFALVLLYSA